MLVSLAEQMPERKRQYPLHGHLLLTALQTRHAELEGGPFLAGARSRLGRMHMIGDANTSFDEEEGNPGMWIKADPVVLTCF